jgi:hypothetical protein
VEQWSDGTMKYCHTKGVNQLCARAAEIRIAGRTLYVPSAEICGRTVVVTGKCLRRASVKDEDLVEGEIVEDPVAFLDELRGSPLRADVLTFSQKIPEITPKYAYHFQWDNWAVVRITSFADWWERRLPQETRKNVRRAAKRGVIVKDVRFDDDFVEDIQRIYNETPIRQGRRFWHFGKDFETIKEISSTYLDRSDFVGAYFNDELIGFIKIVYVDRIATLMHIISKNEHRDKRPMNAMLARAVEVCEKRKVSFLIYGKYDYDGNENSPLIEFKRRNGFEKVKYPRYFVPLTAKGRFAIQLRLHNGVKRLVPRPAINLLRSIRSQFYQRRYPVSGNSPETVC